MRSLKSAESIIQEIRAGEPKNNQNNLSTLSRPSSTPIYSEYISSSHFTQNESLENDILPTNYLAISWEHFRKATVLITKCAISALRFFYLEESHQSTHRQQQKTPRHFGIFFANRTGAGGEKIGLKETGKGGYI